jgi:hypothetical protein
MKLFPMKIVMKFVNENVIVFPPPFIYLDLQQFSLFWKLIKRFDP